MGQIGAVFWGNNMLTSWLVLLMYNYSPDSGDARDQSLNCTNLCYTGNWLTLTHLNMMVITVQLFVIRYLHMYNWTL
jgi:hypothetical protein